MAYLAQETGKPAVHITYIVCDGASNRSIVLIVEALDTDINTFS